MAASWQGRGGGGGGNGERGEGGGVEVGGGVCVLGPVSEESAFPGHLLSGFSWPSRDWQDQ